jgi:hypothetical protein
MLTYGIWEIDGISNDRRGNYAMLRNGDVIEFRHYGTTIALFDYGTRELLKAWATSRSDAEAINNVIYFLHIQYYKGEERYPYVSYGPVSGCKVNFDAR